MSANPAPTRPVGAAMNSTRTPIPRTRITIDAPAGLAWWVPDLGIDATAEMERLRSLDRRCDQCAGFRSVQGRVEDVSVGLRCESCGGTGRAGFDIEVVCGECGDRSEWCGFDRPGDPNCSNGTLRYRASIVPGTLRPVWGGTPDVDGAEPDVAYFLADILGFAGLQPERVVIVDAPSALWSSTFALQLRVWLP